MELENQEENVNEKQIIKNFNNSTHDETKMQMNSKPKPKYKECLKNHAVSIGGHAVDGCGEFLPAGEDGTDEALKCAACNCHRSFHRKITQTHHHQPYNRTTSYFHHHIMPQHRPLALPSTSGGGGYREDQELDMCNPNNNNINGTSLKKRFRTRFSQEHKDKMLELAEKLGWRIQRQDEGAVQQLCNEIGIKRHVFKVWMHNNKYTLGKKLLNPNTQIDP
ncbi:zinc-finger homeodomain protein 1-like [Lycium ferocissimum]|uniref:zinc-finger homeodomain protein 1-like n=1 Tax=Lycium ferocissimum TaxID=112874 RepID=UPI0028150089|nr:zinc-finger homeodomain protein 1-like [Lycium ferocissimum]